VGALSIAPGLPTVRQALTRGIERKKINASKTLPKATIKFAAEQNKA
jgi:hypothetical protein